MKHITKKKDAERSADEDSKVVSGIDKMYKRIL